MHQVRQKILGSSFNAVTAVDSVDDLGDEIGRGEVGRVSDGFNGQRGRPFKARCGPASDRNQV